MSNAENKKTPRIQNQEIIRTIEASGYRNGFLPAAMKKMALVAVLNTSLSMVLIASLVAIYLFRPQPQSYAVSPSGRIVKMIPLSQDVDNNDVGLNVVASFIGNVIIDSYNIDFLNWKKQLAALSSYYTPEGYNNFMQAITPLKDRVVNGRYITSVGMVTPPVIEKSGVINGVLKYRIGMDIMIGFESETKQIAPQKWHIEIIARRVSFSINPIGVAIESAVATIATPNLGN